MRVCLGCGKPLPSLARPNRLYCDGRCRVLAFRRRHDDGISRSLLDRLVEAGGPLSEPRLLAGIQQAARRDWQAAAWVLSHRYPERWGAPAAREARERSFVSDLDR